ncbi:hypothetical protein [Bradyrhizobium sp. USDA 3458]|uniref:hypothetical protein n=1 Tax=Bradyrhizobium sp. USDA 3458 TaxID=2591461 RepID=UPI001143C727|nr:hypothetical protein [Bradyrhizobium sp. USDA 3458]
MTDPAIVAPPNGKFTESEMAAWSQHVGVRRVMLSHIEYEDQYMLVRSLHSIDAINHFAKHGFKYRGRLAFNVPFDHSPAWLINVSLFLGRWT